MAERVTGRVCAEPAGEVVLFLIGVRLNRPWKVRTWLAVVRAMPRMLQELAADPALGLLHARGHFGLRNLMVVQYWRSAAHLTAYAHAPAQAHLPAWRAFNRAVGTSGDVGIWHETYVVPAGNAESIYVNMPRHGLGLAGRVHPAEGRRATAAQRLTRATPAG